MAGHLLIVDDDEGLCNLLGRLLRALGYEADSVTDPRDALERIRGRPYDLVLVDLIMPHIDGLDLVKLMKAEHDVPVIVITGFGSVELAKAAIDAGAVDFVSKPIESTYLDMRIKMALSGAQA